MAACSLPLLIVYELLYIRERDLVTQEADYALFLFQLKPYGHVGDLHAKDTARKTLWAIFMLKTQPVKNTLVEKHIPSS